MWKVSSMRALLKPAGQPPSRQLVGVGSPYDEAMTIAARAQNSPDWSMLLLPLHACRDVSGDESEGRMERRRMLGWARPSRVTVLAERRGYILGQGDGQLLPASCV